MNNIAPSTIIDGFFDNPYEVRKYGLSVSKSVETHNQITYRGKRSKCLSEIHPLLFDAINYKIFSIFYNLRSEQNISWRSEIKYQLTDESFGDGWIHSDYDTPSLLTGIIYLNPDSPLDCGTSLYKPKNLVARVLHEDVKKNANINEESRRTDYYHQCRNENNEQFEKILTVNNVFNRLFLFDSSYYHCADRFFGKTDEESRLTLAIFIRELYVRETPITRIRSI